MPLNRAEPFKGIRVIGGLRLNTMSDSVVVPVRHSVISDQRIPVRRSSGLPAVRGAARSTMRTNLSEFLYGNG